MENQILQAIKELQDQMNNGFKKLEHRIDKLEEGQEDIREQLALLVEEQI